MSHRHAPYFSIGGVIFIMTEVIIKILLHIFLRSVLAYKIIQGEGAICPEVHQIILTICRTPG